jgi:hypothetical protein
MSQQTVTRKDSNVRLSLYVAIAMATAASTGLGTLDLADPKAVFGFALQIILSGLITARAYIDQTPNQIQP